VFFDEHLSRARHDPGAGKIAPCRRCRGFVNFDDGELSTTDPPGCRRKKADPTVEINDGFIPGLDQGGDSLEEPRDQVAIALKERADGDL